MTDYLIVKSIKPLRVARGSRAALSKISASGKEHLKEDYEKKTGIKVKSPKKQGLAQDHRVSDADIQDNIICDINTDFANDLTLDLIENVFPWNPNGIEKNRAKRLLLTLKESKDNKIKLESANGLIELMSLHTENLSYGNSSQNSAIGRRLDLNAPKDGNDRHSLSPRSRKISTELFVNKKDLIFSPPKHQTRNTFFSSQYATGGKKNKEQKNINIRQATPRTERILQAAIMSDDNYNAAYNFFRDHFGKSQIDAIKQIPNYSLVLLHERYQEFLEEIDLSADDFFGTPLRKLVLMSDASFLALIQEDYCAWDDLSSISEKKLKDMFDHAERIYEVMSDYTVSISQIAELSSAELQEFMECDLEKAIFENGYTFEQLVKLYRKDPLHLTCLTSDLYDLVLEHAPDIPKIMLNYAEALDIDLEEISDSLCKSERLLMSWNYGTVC